MCTVSQLFVSTSSFSLSLSSTLFLFEGISQNILHLDATPTDLCSEVYAYKGLMPTANCVLLSILCCNKALLLPVY
jgi:hypothetical protein